MIIKPYCWKIIPSKSLKFFNMFVYNNYRFRYKKSLYNWRRIKSSTKPYKFTFKHNKLNIRILDNNINNKLYIFIIYYELYILSNKYIFNNNKVRWADEYGKQLKYIMNF